MQVRSSIFFCIPKRKRWRVRNDHGGTSRRERRLLSSVLISSFPNRKRCAGLRFGEGISISPRTPLNRPRKPLRFSWIFPARTDRYALKFPFPASHLPLPLGEVAERSEDGEGISGCNTLSVTFGDSSPKGGAKGVLSRENGAYPYRYAPSTVLRPPIKRGDFPVRMSQHPGRRAGRFS